MKRIAAIIGASFGRGREFVCGITVKDAENPDEIRMNHQKPPRKESK